MSKSSKFNEVKRRGWQWHLLYKQSQHEDLLDTKMKINSPELSYNMYS